MHLTISDHLENLVSATTVVCGIGSIKLFCGKNYSFCI